MKPGIARIALVIAVAAVLGGCSVCLDGDAVKGSGKKIEQVRDLPSFEKIVLTGAAKLDVQASAAQKVVVEADDNIVPLIETEVQGGVLRIKRTKSFRDVFDHGVTVRISVPQLHGIEVSGACTAKVAGLSGGEFALEINGAGELEASGEVDDLRIAVAGAGQMDLVALKAKRADVNVAGAGNVKLTVTEELVAKVSGVGEIRYGGDPARVQPKILGVGKISPL